MHSDVGDEVGALGNRSFVENYDMSESISRSDTFDIVHYALDLDLTNYGLQQMQARALIEVSVIESGAEEIWFDLLSLTVDSVNIDGASSGFVHENGRLIVPSPNAVFQSGDAHEIEVFYGGHPEQDPSWGGVYFTAGYIYHMGIGLTSIPPNYGKVWHPCFDNFVERATLRLECPKRRRNGGAPSRNLSGRDF